MKMNLTLMLALCSALLASVALARPVSQETAELAGWAWAVRGKTLGVTMGERIADSTVHTTDSGAKFYTVKMKDGGTIVLTSDDELEPVLAFFDEEADFTTFDKESPAWAILNGHVSAMSEGLGVKRSPVQPSTSNHQSATAAQKRWAALIAEGEEIKANGLPKAGTRKGDGDIGDMRVPALCKTKWSQGGGIYNYYTPYHRVCGCVATAQSQIMRKHCWPTKSLKKITRTCTVLGVSTNLTTQGGVFDWANMPVTRATKEIQKQAIGKLTSDVGIALQSSYAKGGTGAYTIDVRNTLRNDFGYGAAVYAGSCTLFATNKVYRSLGLAHVFFANFDAGLPISIGLSGHEILADGYGYIDTVDYVHFNFGWGGQYNAWYHIPDLTDAGKSYYYIDDLVYNIMPTNSMSEAVLSGRVLDKHGYPVAGATVKAYSGGTLKATTVSSLYGVWAFILPGGKSTANTYSISVDAIGNCEAGTLTGLTLYAPSGSSVSCDYKSDVQGLGNSWGNDIKLELKNPDYPEVPNTGATFERHAVGDTRVIDEDDFGGIAKETYKGKFWWGPDGEGVVSSGSGGTDDKHASFTGVVCRAIHNTYDVTNAVAKSVGDFVAEEIGGGNFVFDAWVRLEDGGGTDAFLPDDEAKVLVKVRNGELVVIAGDGVNDRSTKAYETGVKVDTGVMHRVTIKMESAGGGEGTPVFHVWIDRRRVPGAFPSRILAGEDAGKLRAMGFSGMDVSVDDVFFSRELPFVLPGMMFLVR